MFLPNPCLVNLKKNKNKKSFALKIPPVHFCFGLLYSLCNMLYSNYDKYSPTFWNVFHNDFP